MVDAICPMANLTVANGDIVRIVVRFVAHEEFLFFAPVCRDWREAWGQRPTITSVIPTPETTVTQLRYSFECGAPRHNIRVCTTIARLGNLDLLRCARESGCPWSARTCQEAAKGGHLDILRWARANGCDWDARTCSTASREGHLELLMWARRHGCPWDKNTSSAAAWRGHLEVLRWAIENGCDWDATTCAFAAAGGHLDCLQWARENGCP